MPVKGYAIIGENDKVPTAQLGGPGADNTKFLRGDQTWQVPPTGGGTGGGDGEIVVRKVSDTSTTGTSFADAVELSFAAAANADYLIEAWLIVDTSAATVGVNIGANGPASPLSVSGIWVACPGMGTLDGSGFVTYNQTGGTTASLQNVAGNLVRLHCLFRNGPNAGTFIIRFAAETSGGTVTIKAGSILKYRQTN